ncbi:peptidase T2, asparaginase 2 [Reticulomyxa filosa]|uniref:beta-aspartyl-peptidase n=1 Tax=Reticulomyxa filosa TaxID=46433 RepID=X6N5P0_RETFI|nr:peptidase T2, asparaginase 2 [Reticulomyxa filosa]|eukprot:ETO21600.1 peptidase T2, asparaginase 2 [Reticulomyxa filosa]
MITIDRAKFSALFFVKETSRKLILILIIMPFRFVTPTQRLALLTFLISAIYVMRKLRPGLAKKALSLLTCSKKNHDQLEYAIVFHGGAGTIATNIDSTSRYEALIRVLRESSKYIQEQIKKGKESLTACDIAEYVVILLENEPLFNAGKGAVFNIAGLFFFIVLKKKIKMFTNLLLKKLGKHELEASIMEGKTLNCGSAALLRHIKNPIRLARDVMTCTPHIMLVGEGAEEFASKESDLVSYRPRTFHELVDNTYFSTEYRNQQLKESRANLQSSQDENEGKTDQVTEKIEINGNEHIQEKSTENGFGTVGCVVMYKGSVAAATSTGGRTNKMCGRIGDTPIIGAGNYAGEYCAISGTGFGEDFVRNVTAYDCHARMKYLEMDIQQAIQSHINESFKPDTGGMIGVDRYGNIGIGMNSSGMYRGWLTSKNKSIGCVAIWDQAIDVVTE